MIYILIILACCAAISFVMYLASAARLKREMQLNEHELKRWRSLIRVNDVVLLKSEKVVGVVTFVTSETVLIEDVEGNMRSVSKQSLMPV